MVIAFSHWWRSAVTIPHPPGFVKKPKLARMLKHNVQRGAEDSWCDCDNLGANFAIEAKFRLF